MFKRAHTSSAGNRTRTGWGAAALIGALVAGVVGGAAAPAAAAPTAGSATTAATADGARRSAASVDPSNRASSLAFWRSDHTPSPDPAWTGSVAACNAGTTSAAYKASVGKRIDYFRAMAGIPGSVVIDPALSAEAQQAALMMAANNQLSHTPPSTWACYSTAGATGASRSNLNMGSSGADSINSYMGDNGPGNTAAGHRRWVLFPPRTAFGTGDIPVSPHTNALEVFGATGPRPVTRTEFVAWPPAGYVPIGVIYKRWSLSLPGADFSSATVTMSKNGAAYPVTKEPLSSNSYGDNTLVWAVPDIADGGTMPAPAADTTFSVTVAGAVVGGVARTFTYQVTAFDPDPQPDLVVTSITASPASPKAGDDVTFSATIRNAGNGPAAPGTHRTMFTVDNYLTATADSAVQLAPGASTTVTGSTPWTATEGVRSVRAYADWSSAIPERDEWNNNTAISLTVAAGPTGPDLQVLSVAANPATPTAGDSVVFSAQIVNRGTTATAGGWRTSFRVNGVEVQVGDRSTALPAGYSTTISASAPAPWRATAGSHTVTAFADSLAAVTETNEGNNSGSLALTVTGPAAQPDLVVDSLNVAPGAPVAGDAVSFSATIRNAGTATVPAGTTDVVRFDVDGSQVATGSTTGSLAPGASTTVSASGTWSAVQGGHTVLAAVDATGAIAESDEANNGRSAGFTVGARPELRPDLVVTGLSTAPAHLAAGDAVTFSATVRNDGASGVPAGTPLRVAFSTGSTALSWADTTAGLAPGASMTLTATGGPSGSRTWTATGGSRNVTAMADSTGVVDESAEYNNTWTTSLRVSTVTTVQDSKLGYGGWRLGSGLRTSSTAGDTVELAFTGKSISWITRGGPDRGRASVTIDGVSRGTVDLYRAGASTVTVPFTGLSAAAHRLQIRVLGTSAPASTGTAVALDGLKIGTSPAVQETSDRISFSGWSGAAAAAANGGHYRTAAAPGATTSWTFSGTGVDWITATGPAYGQARVSIDGVDRGTVDLYSASASWRTLQSFRGLGAGTHTVVITVLGARNAASGGTGVVVDGLRALS